MKPGINKMLRHLTQQSDQVILKLFDNNVILRFDDIP